MIVFIREIVVPLESTTGWYLTTSNAGVVQITQHTGTSRLSLNFLAPGSSQMTIRASNAYGSSSRTFTITVSPAQ